MSIDKDSAGPSVDALAIKFGGTEPTELDFRRTQTVRIVMEGVVTGHSFVDKYDQHGDRVQTIKTAIVKADGLISVEVIHRAKVTGQTSMNVDGEEVDGEPVVPADPDHQVTDAQVVGELNPGTPPPGVDPATGEIIAGEPQDEEPEGEEPPAEPESDVQWD